MEKACACYFFTSNRCAPLPSHETTFLFYPGIGKVWEDFPPGCVSTIETTTQHFGWFNLFFSKVKRAMGRAAVSHTSYTARPQHMTTAFTTYLSDHGVTTHLTAVYNPSLEPFPLCCDRNPTM